MTISAYGALLALFLLLRGNWLVRRLRVIGKDVDALNKYYFRNAYVELEVEAYTLSNKVRRLITQSMILEAIWAMGIGLFLWMVYDKYPNINLPGILSIMAIACAVGVNIWTYLSSLVIMEDTVQTNLARLARSAERFRTYSSGK